MRLKVTGWFAKKYAASEKNQGVVQKPDKNREKEIREKLLFANQLQG